MSEPGDWHELIDRHLRGELDETEMERLAELLDSDPAARKDFVDQVQWDTQLAEVLREGDTANRVSPEAIASDFAGGPREGRSATPRGRSPVAILARMLLAIAAGVVIVLAASLYLQRTATERPIAKITGLSGALQWTGNGGQVFSDLSVGRKLVGGTVEGMTPGSWFELTFNDGSTVTISGTSMLTFSDHGQKTLHLKEGNLSGNVKPQPTGQPMLIHTRTALLEVLGTRFEVEAELSETMLAVTQGSVRVQRLSDGSTVDVRAKHRLIASADRKMLPVLSPDAVSQWQSQLQLGPEGAFGKWSPGTSQEVAHLKAIPYTTSEGKTIFTAAMSVSRGDMPPVILQPTSQFRVRGRIATARKIYFGVTLRRANGDFAGKFQITHPAAQFRGGEDFDVTVHLRDFRLDPSLNKVKHKLPGSPYGYVVESFWSHTLYEQAGLEIADVQLLGSETEP